MSSAATRKPRPGDVLDVWLEEIDERGHTTGTSDAYAVRLRGGVPGTRVRARVRRRRGSRIDATLEEVLTGSETEVEPRCAHFTTCGGCSFQGIAYPAQLELLGRMLARTLTALGAPAIEPVLAAPSPWNYRNKMDFTFGSRRWVEPDEPEGVARDFAVGLHVPGRFDKVLDVTRCDIAFVEASGILGTVRTLASERGLAPWDVRAHRGLLRHLVLRKGVRTGEVLVDLVTTEEAPAEIEPLARDVLVRHPEVTTFVQRVDAGVALVARGEERVHHGPGFIRERVAGLEFRVSAASFFQTNTEQAEALVGLVEEAADVDQGTSVFDLYCGSGLFALALARSGARVTGFELVPEAVRDARENAARGGVEGVRFVCGDVMTTLPEALAESAPEVLVVDPPRAGVHPSVLAALRNATPRRVVYVSCNPKSAARDLAALVTDGYALARVQPLDLFPHTPHLECVFTLERGGLASSGARR